MTSRIAVRPFCPQCQQKLYKTPIVDVKTSEDMGHVWLCLDYDTRYVGFGNSGEYDGKTKD